MSAKKKNSSWLKNGQSSYKSASLFPESDDSSEDEQNAQDKKSGGGLNINKNYADHYDNWRNKEELMKIKARFGTTNLEEIENEEDDDESASSSDEDWTEEKEKAFFKTLSNLKKKDPKIYDPTVKFFNNEGDQDAKISSPSKKKKDKPFLLKDHERTMILEKGTLASDDEDDEKSAKNMSYFDELASIKNSFNKVMNEMDEDDDNDLLTKAKDKTEDEKDKEEEDYKLWLKGELGKLEKGKLSKDEEKELSFLRSYWNDDKLDEGEKFLRDYILNKKYIEKGESSSSKKKASKQDFVADDEEDDGEPSNDEEFEEKQEEFEHKYNFRFEEPDPEFIKRFPRTIEDSLRRENERRKKQRESAKDRKNEAKERKKEEVQRLKALKRKEIMDKIKKLQEVCGNGEDELPFEDLDIDGDFDPEEYDRKMAQVFSDENYYKDEEEGGKPQFPYDPEIDDEVNWEEWVPKTEDDEEEEMPEKSSKKSKKPQLEIKEEIDDEEEDEEPRPSTSKKGSFSQELIESSKKKKSGKKASPFLSALEKKKPKFDPLVHKSFEQYFQEYYALDFEDLVGDLPCRFKYRKVAPNDFGLTMNEILKAPDKELNQWASLKKTYQYRPEEEEIYEAQAYKKKGEDEKLKKRVLPSVYQPLKTEEDDEDSEIAEQPETNDEKISKSKKKKNRKKAKKLQLNPESTAKITENHVQNVKEEIIMPEEMEEEGIEETETIKSNEEASASSTSETKTKLSKRQRKMRAKKAKQLANGSNPEISPSTTPIKPPTEEKKQKKKQAGESNGNIKKGPQKRKASESAKPEVEDERLKAYGLNPKKYKKWVKYGGKQ